jgi:hypothetical protein
MMGIGDLRSGLKWILRAAHLPGYWRSAPEPIQGRHCKKGPNAGKTGFLMERRGGAFDGTESGCWSSRINQKNWTRKLKAKMWMEMKTAI